MQRIEIPREWTQVQAPLRDPRTRYAFQGANAMRKATTPHLRAPNWLLPGVHAADMRFRQFSLALAREATKAFPSAVRPDGFAGASAVTGDFSALLSVSGCEMTPAAAPLLDRRRLLTEKGLTLEFLSDRDRRVFRALHRLMFGKRRKGGAMRFSRVSSTSNPFFEFDVVWKKEMILHLIRHVDEILKMVERDDFDGLRSHGMVFCSTLVKRRQPEGGDGLMEKIFTPKPREVVDTAYALSGGQRGRKLIADKRFALRPWVPDSFSHAAAMRVRTAWGYGAAVTYLLTAMFTQCRDHYYGEYGFTWHHTTREQIASKVRGAYAIMGADVTQMDQLYPDFLLAAHAEWCADYFHPAVAKMEDWVNWSPYYAPSPGPGLPAYWGGDPRHIDGSIRPGLNSGRATNPDLGKWGMTGAYILLLASVWPSILTFRGDLDASLDGFLRGEHPDVALLDMADDACFIVRDTASGKQGAPELDRLLRSGKGSRYFAIGFEDGISFLGNVFRRDENGADMLPTPNPITYLVNWFCPEHGIDSVHRRYWGLGTLEREKHYGANPVVADLGTLVRELWVHYFPAGYDHPLAAATAHARRHRPEAQLGDSYADLAVRMNPDLLHYRFRPEDVSSATLDMVSAYVEASVIDSLSPYLPPAY